MKKIIAVWIAAVLTFSLSGCSWFKTEEPPVVEESMSLSAKTWNWVNAITADGETLTPNKPDVFTLIFNTGGQVSVGTDCNNMSGQYTADNTSLVLGEMMSTLMYCDGSQEQEFSALLAAVTNYRFTDDDELILFSETEPDLMVVLD